MGAPSLVYSLSLLQNRALAASKRNRPGRSRPGRLPIQVMALGHLSQRLMTMLSGPRDKMASAGSS